MIAVPTYFLTQLADVQLFNKFVPLHHMQTLNSRMLIHSKSAQKILYHQFSLYQ